MRWIIPACCLLAVVLGGTVGAEEQKPAEPSEEAQMMEAWARASSPGAEHEMLAKMAGEWNVKARFWMEPGAEPLESTGVASRTMMLDGRVLSETFEGEFMGMPFSGHGMTGFDNQSQRWWGTWNDTMSTGLMLSHGQCNDAMTRCMFLSETVDPMTGKIAYNKSVMTSVSDDRETFVTWTIGPDGEEHKTMELLYTRKK